MTPNWRIRSVLSIRLRAPVVIETLHAGNSHHYTLLRYTVGATILYKYIYLRTYCVYVSTAAAATAAVVRTAATASYRRRPLRRGVNVRRAPSQHRSTP